MQRSPYVSDIGTVLLAENDKSASAAGAGTVIVAARRL